MPSFSDPPEAEGYAQQTAAAQLFDRLKKILFPASIVVAAVVVPALTDRSFLHNILIFIALYALLGVGWNIIGGYTGQPALGNAVFYGLGAYSTVLALRIWGLSPWIGMAIGVFIAMLSAVALGSATFRLRGHYFAIATFTIGETVSQAFNSWIQVGGQEGLIVPVKDESWFNLQFHTSRIPYYYIILGFLLLAVMINYWIERIQLGYYLRAIKADEVAAASLGINVMRYKLIAFMISAGITAIGGSFIAMFVLFIDPISVFHFRISLQAMLVTVLGGIGVLWGPILGSTILISLSETTRTVLGGTGRALDLLIYGLMIMLLAVLEPNGLTGLGRRFRAFLTKEES